MSKMSFLDFHYGLSRKSFPKKPTAPLLSTKGRPKPTTTPSSSCSKSRSFQPNVEEMKWVFEKFDTNKDGKISWEEYKCAVNALNDKARVEAEVFKAFQALDKDGDGFIDFMEFMEMHSMGGVQSSDIEDAFQVFDLDQDGKISAEELMEVMKKLGEKHNLGACRNMVKGVDSDGDGLIDKEEFVTLMTRTMKLS